MEDHTLIEVSTKLNSVLDGIDSIKEKQDALASDISKIKEAMYDPDQGLYARVRELERRILELESFKAVTSRITWITITGVIGLAIIAFKNHFI